MPQMWQSKFPWPKEWSGTQQAVTQFVVLYYGKRETIYQLFEEVEFDEAFFSIHIPEDSKGEPIGGAGSQNIHYPKDRRLATRGVMLQLRYSFNPRCSKYKGSVANNEVIKLKWLHTISRCKSVKRYFLKLRWLWFDLQWFLLSDRCRYEDLRSTGRHLDFFVALRLLWICFHEHAWELHSDVHSLLWYHFL